MFKKKKIICVIPARKGSTRIKNKNLIILNKKPLIYWSIYAAKKSKFIDAIFVSSDDDKILKLGMENGCKIKLDPRLVIFFMLAIFKSRG